MGISIMQQQSQACRLGEGGGGGEGVVHLDPVGDAVGGGACGVLQTDDGRHHHVIRAAHQGSHKSGPAALLQPESVFWQSCQAAERWQTLCKQGHRRSRSASMAMNGHSGPRGLQERLKQLQQAVPWCRPVSMMLSRPAAHEAKQRA